ncbi:MAG: polyprenyl synthetase family protein [Limnochordaceae bacterium]|nr:polyprenyl synthetase family protein [Limnochordaceae bacterium]
MNECWTVWQQQVEEAVDRLVPVDAYPPRLWQAMRYTAVGGGKRLRGSLVLASCAIIRGTETGDQAQALPAAVAVELVHAYSLIHDDLPLMDDDDWRRGKPTNHKVFGPAMALLAGDGLLARAFEVLTMPLREVNPSADRSSSGAADPRAEVELQWAWVRELSQAAGPSALVGGQAMDWLLEQEGATLPADERAGALEYVHRHKTGALIRASVRMGALAGLPPEQRRKADEDETMVRLTVYGAELGLAFQITDDLLDEVGRPEQTGKGVGRDRARGKVTYVSIYGLEAAQQAAARALARAQEAVQPLGKRAQPLVELAQGLLARRK